MISGLVFIFNYFNQALQFVKQEVSIFCKNRISIDQLKHQEKVTPSLHKLCKYCNSFQLWKLYLVVGPQKWDYITFICLLWEQK